MTPQDRLNAAVLYALREGCFFPVPQPSPNSSVQSWVRWGALRNLHDAIAAFYPVAVHPAAPRDEEP